MSDEIFVWQMCGMIR